MATYNLYKLHQSDQKVFRYFNVNNQLFVFYNCPRIDKLVQLYNVLNQLLFSIGGKRTIHQGNQSWDITRDTSFMLKRVAFHQEIYDDTEGWKVLAFYIKDDYFKNILNEFRSLLNLNNCLSVGKTKGTIQGGLF